MLMKSTPSGFLENIGYTMKLKVAFRNKNLLPYYSQIHFLQDVFTANIVED